jgi:hypothetical protein
MDTHTDYTAKLTTETEYGNLYKWCVQEIDAEGEEIGTDLVPWNWSLNFTGSKLRYFFKISSQNSSHSAVWDDDEAEE